ncbi:PEP/pyruvate-binding domain-containing protein [Candidatus Formimonas warabiya]|uniref:Phosphoenolpyruvate synthase n=1 Tax=Formimonas warabiya TaxID=1761012 RepID=A0A3G1KY51_FORW1|nr:PEP/pyruvate-binding domain-containing protein [Candidatus Formimonas warabiya]ATW27340.1 phosphoenolpyruvate synthase [Candidatus Formimonas warabiya]
MDFTPSGSDFGNTHFGKPSTGVPGLDYIIDYLRLGDNVVLHVDSIDDYIYFVTPFVEQAHQEGKKINYIRFAEHKPLIAPGENVTIYDLDANAGFEVFSTQVHQIATREGEGVYYVFDCLSELLSAWATDLMIGNFFNITCPYLYELNTIAYFSILRNRNSFSTVATIRETTQLLLDIYNCDGDVFVHPLKAQNRYSPSMFFPHVQRGENFVPVTSGVDGAKLYACVISRGLGKTERNWDYWDQVFFKASEIYEKAQKQDQSGGTEETKMVETICKMVLSKDKTILNLVKNNFCLGDLLDIKSRMIGSGFIGGKTVGMLLARKILDQNPLLKWDDFLEPHDSYYIGSDVFYTFLVQNGWWKLRMEQKCPDKYFQAAKELKEKIMKGRLPEAVRDQFKRMLEHFGQSPIVVRSSSLLEDGFGNAFAGKYVSIFCVNQGTPEQRYQEFEKAVRTAYASTMNEDALNYRLQRGLAEKDEQMALLVQRVSGTYHGDYFFPDIAGVGLSYNTYVWKDSMAPEAGMLRLVFGLGTRAVGRTEGDYPRVVALDAPLLRPCGNMDDIRKYSQHEVDVLNIKENQWETISFRQLTNEKLDLRLNLVAVKDWETEKKLKELGMAGEQAWVVTFDKLLSNPDFLNTMQSMLKILEEGYQCPVDVEFTVNFDTEEKPRINLLQCRSLQTKGQHTKVNIPQSIEEKDILFRSTGNFMGGNLELLINRIIFIDPQQYHQLPIRNKYDIAHLIGEINRLVDDNAETATLLLGPGRWGSSTPSLGVPVTFSDINHMRVLGEVAFFTAGFCPELSFGTHFFQDLVETDIFYVAIFPEKEDVIFNQKWLDEAPNHLGTILPGNDQWMHVVKVIDLSQAFPGKNLYINADLVSQKIICYTL